MDFGDYYQGLYRDYYRDPFPRSLLSTWETKTSVLAELAKSGEACWLYVGHNIRRYRGRSIYIYIYAEIIRGYVVHLAC